MDDDGEEGGGDEMKTRGRGVKKPKGEDGSQFFCWV